MAHGSYWDGNSQFWGPPPLQPAMSNGNGGFNPSQSRKRRAPRAAQACDSCRIRKTACNEERPCLNCHKDGIACKYSSRKSLPRHLTDIDAALHQLHKFAGELDTQVKKFSEFKSRFDQLESCIKANEEKMGSMPKRDAEPPKAKKSNSEPWHLSGSHHLIALWPAMSQLLLQSQYPVAPNYVMKAEDGQNAAASTSKHHDLTLPLMRSPHMSQVDLLLQGFVENIYSLHPIIDLEPLIRKGIFAQVHGNVALHSFPSPPAKRRKYEDEDSASVSTGAETPGQDVGDDLDVALANMILALGEICIYKKSSTHPPATPTSMTSSSTNKTFDFPSFATSAGNASISPKSSHTFTSFENQYRPQSKIREAGIPGMKYYNCATSIWARYSDGTELKHAQFYILAGLYKSQLGQTRESLNWICSAGRTAQALLRRHDLLETSTEISYLNSQTKLRQRIQGSDQHLIVIAAWTSLILETDIMSELPLPGSGISELENRLPYPIRIPGIEIACKLMSDTFTERNKVTAYNILVLYSSQLWLRKRLNRIANELYANHIGSEFTDQQILEVLEDHKLTLAEWRKSLPTEFVWHDDSAPSEGILIARLRAKYFGAMFVAHRPFLDYVLNAMPAEAVATLPSVVDASDHRRTDVAAVHLFRAIRTMPPEDVMASALHCIDAGFQSSYVFDAILHQLIVTNIHGTAHAQFANCIVIATALFSGKVEIDKHRVIALLRRTTHFLERQTFLPPSCRIDHNILVKILEHGLSD